METKEVKAEIKIVAFLQNMWFRDPERMQQQLDGPFKGDRERFIRTWLFWNCLTGKRLMNAFGEEWCDRIIWEEQSPFLGGTSGSKFPADLAHIRKVLRKHKPPIILTFGRLATDALCSLNHNAGVSFTQIEAPHPAARGGSVISKLKLACCMLNDELAAITAVHKNDSAALPSSDMPDCLL